MRFVCFRGSDGPRLGAVRNDGYVDLNRTDPSIPTCLVELLKQEDGLPRAAEALKQAEAIPPDRVQLLPPVRCPQKIICVGVNYADHAKESGMEVPPEPVIFNKFPTALCGPDQPVVLPRVAQQVDYEAELVVVIGRTGRYIPAEQARDYVAGYCCGNDISARDWQLHKPGRQWLLGKSFDTFAPLGPAMVTADEVPDPGNLTIELRLNGQTMQRSNTNQLIKSVEQLIAYVSQVCTLQVGDLLFTGTPGGVGMGRTPPVYLKPGDVVEVEIEHLGVLRNPIVAESQ